LTPFQGSTSNMTEMGLGTKILGWPGAEFPFCRRSVALLLLLLLHAPANASPPYTLIQSSFKSFPSGKFSTLFCACALSVIHHIFLRPS